jgi:hypothetical protein
MVTFWLRRSGVHGASRIYDWRRFRSRAPMTIPMMIEPNTKAMIVRYSIDAA